MKIMVLGGNGFIGKNLCHFLNFTEHSVYSFDLSLPKEKKEGINYITGNFFDAEFLKKSINGMDVIFHSICTMNPGTSNDLYLNAYQNDFMQTVKLCEYAQENKVKLIFISSGGTVYGEHQHQPIEENSRTRPINHYGNLKLCIENTLLVFNKQIHSKNIIARVANPYGPYQNYLSGVGFIDSVLKHAIKHEEINIWGDGTTIRDYIYIDDVCTMLYQLALYDGDEDVFNISSGIGASQNEIIKIVKNLIPDITVSYKPTRSVDIPCIILNNSRIEKITFNECLLLEKGIEKYYSYLCENTNNWMEHY